MIFSSLYSTREFHSLNVIVLFQIRANMLLAFRQKAVLDTDCVPVEWVHNRYRSIIKFSAQINELVSFWLSRRPFENFEISFTFNKAWKANKWLNLTRFNRFSLDISLFVVDRSLNLERHHGYITLQQRHDLLTCNLHDKTIFVQHLARESDNFVWLICDWFLLTA